jgi:hypothetical protein
MCTVELPVNDRGGKQKKTGLKIINKSARTMVNGEPPSAEEETRGLKQ